MLKYTKLKHILNFIPKTIRENEDDLDLLTYALDAYRRLNISQRYINKIVILPINSHKVEMPKGLCKINVVTYFENDLTEKESCSLLCNLKIPKPPIMSPPKIDCGCNKCHNNCGCKCHNSPYTEESILTVPSSVPKQGFKVHYVPGTTTVINTDDDCQSVFGVNVDCLNSADCMSIFGSPIDCAASSVFNDETFSCGCGTEEVENPGYSFYSCCQDRANHRMNRVCKLPLTYQFVLNSEFYNNCNVPLKYVGNSTEFLCDGCPNKQVQCEDTFSINPITQQIITSCEEGFICLNYEEELKDEDGDFMIIDHPKVRHWLRLWTLYMHWLGRAFVKEEHAFSMSDRLLSQAEIALKAAKGALTQRTIDLSLINSISENTATTAILKIPSKFSERYYHRDFGEHIKTKKPYGNKH